MEVDHGFDAAANMILDVVEREFGLKPRNGRPLTHRAIMRIMEHFGIEKAEQQIGECDCWACKISPKRSKSYPSPEEQ